MDTIDLSGTYHVIIDSDILYEANLPGTLDENQIGYRDCCSGLLHPDTVPNLLPDFLTGMIPDVLPDHDTDADAGDHKKSADNLYTGGIITSRFTRKYTYEGKAAYSRMFSYTESEPKRIFLEIERSRKLFARLNGQDLLPFEQGTLSTPYVFEVTDIIRKMNELMFISDNSYEGWPREAILYSSAASDETQTNWNGLLGYIRLRLETQNFISHIRIYPYGRKIDIIIEIQTAAAGKETLHVESAALKSTFIQHVNLNNGANIIKIRGLELTENAAPWDEYEGNLYSLQVYGTNLSLKSEMFGIRDFGNPENCGNSGDGFLTLNNHRIFLRGETNCCVFPESGHMPMDIESWEKIFEIYKSYGVNCVRFHSHCPPEAAFIAADRLGILVQPELSHWDPKTAFESEESFAYYQLEMESILRAYSNHPSFVMLTLGNELHANETGIRRMHFLLRAAKEIDSTRLFANASNAFYGERDTDPESGFYTAAAFFQDMLRGTASGMTGHINRQYPNAKTNYDSALEKLRKVYKKPVFAFEAGQYEILPDFDEIPAFKDVTVPANLIAMKNRAKKSGLMDDWKMRVAATGELSLIAYREEVESIMRTREMSGISLLGLQDFPGQGTALIGMLNSHMQPKPFDFAKPERFRKFFTSVLPLILLEKYTYTAGETLHAAVFLANYGKTAIHDVFSYQLSDSGNICFEKEEGFIDCNHSSLVSIGKVTIPLKSLDSAGKFLLSVSVGPYRNEYPVWIYPDMQVAIPDEISITVSLSEAEAELKKGRKVLLSPEASEESFKNSIKTFFTTDFWSVGTFPEQEGYMGCMMNPDHAVFRKFPTEFHADRQWWSITDARAMVLPDNLHSLITALDCSSKLRNLSFLFSCKSGSGKLMVSSMGLLQKQQYPEARALLSSILSYMESDDFEPVQVLPEDTLASFLN